MNKEKPNLHKSTKKYPSGKYRCKENKASESERLKCPKNLEKN